MSTNSECHVVKSDQTYFYFRRDENQLALSKRQGKQQDQQVFSCLAEDQCERRANRKTQAIQTNIEKRRIARRGFAQSKGGIKGIRKLTDL